MNYFHKTLYLDTCQGSKYAYDKNMIIESI